jgi:signal transduction histidine kinase
MRFFHSLQFKLSLLVLTFGSLLIGLGVLQQRQRDVARQMETLRGDALGASARLAGISQHALRREMSSMVDLALSYVAASRDLTLGVVTNQDNAVLHVTDRQWLGKPLKDTPLNSAAETTRVVRSTMSSTLVETANEILSVAPFLMGDDMRSRGVVVLGYDKRNILSKAARRAQEDAIRFSIFLVGACLVLWLALNLMVTERVAMVLRQTDLAAGKMRPPKPLVGKDEFATMSRAFYNSMRNRQELWESQQPLWKLVDGLKDVFWSVSLGPDQNWYVNPAYEKVWGRAIDRLKRDRFDWLRAMSKADRKRVMAAFIALRAGRAVEDLRLKLATADGAKRVLCRSFPVRGAAGDVISMAGLVIDVTEVHTVNRRLAEVSEQERRRMGWDLHDDLCQRLVGTLFKCNAMVTAMKRNEVTQPERLEQIAEEITETTQLARSLARGLAPVLQGGGGLEAALEHLAMYLRKSFQVRCETALDPRLPPLQPESATHLYRIAQELATNAVKHGGATHIEILLWREDDDLELQIRSNGRPFGGLNANLEQGAGMGMHMVRQRLEILGAQITFSSATEEDPWNLAVCDVPVEEVAFDPEANEGFNGGESA